MRITEIVWISDKDAGKLPYIDGLGNDYTYEVDYLYDCNECYCYLNYHNGNFNGNFNKDAPSPTRMPRWLVMI